jgi:catechol 2,3-dioxygenase
MRPGTVRALRAVELSVRDLAAASRFFTDAWRLEEEGRKDGIAYFRGASTLRWILSLRQGARTEVARIVFDVASEADVEHLHGKVARWPGTEASAPDAVSAPGGGWGFEFNDPEGRRYLAVTGIADHASPLPDADRPRKISHVNLNSADSAASSAFLCEVLGFRISDQTRKMQFLRCSADHHSVVLAFAKHATLNHIAFGMADLESLMRGIGRLRDHGYTIEWGPGRHGPGNNAFAYFVGPEDLPLEYTAEMQQCDDSYISRPVEAWTWPPGRLDHWGLTPGPSARFEATQSAVGFSSADQPGDGAGS